MDYEQARILIETGDLIAVRKKNGLLARTTAFLTRKPQTHTGIALWLGDGLWLAELNGGGNHMVPMSQLADADFDVYFCPVDSAKVRESIVSHMRARKKYGFAGLIVIGLLNWFRIKLQSWSHRIIVCSGYCASVFKDAGWTEVNTFLLSPGELAGMLTLKFEVRKEKK